MSKKYPALSDNDLPVLTDKQGAFLLGLMAGKPHAQAYRDAYNAEGMNQNSVWVEASKLVRHPKIARWLAMASDMHLMRAAIAKAQHIEKLQEIRDLAIEDGQLAVASKTQDSIGTAAGINAKESADNGTVKVALSLALQNAKTFTPGTLIDNPDQGTE